MLLTDKERLEKVKRMLVSQPPPQDENSPYFKLAKQYNITLDFLPFIKIAPVTLQEFRNQKIDIAAHTAIIFTSRNAIDHFFRLAKSAKINISPDMKYFCISEQTAHYLHKYIVIRKRKIFTGERSATDLVEVLKGHTKEKYIFPCSDLRTNDIPAFAQAHGLVYQEMIIYHTRANDLSSLKDCHYDIITFFSPSGVKSWLTNFPDFQQNNTRIAAFGPTTAQAVRDKNLILDIEAPLPDVPSMVGALERYIQQTNA